MRKILLITRPICPPWDEASKNFAYYLAKNIQGIEFGLLTKGNVPDLPANVHQHPIYTSGSLNFDFWQKSKLLKLINIRKQYDVLHFMLTPAKLNSFAFRTFLKSKQLKTIQTVATLREDLFRDSDFKKILFADLIITYSAYAQNKLKSLGFENVKCVYPGIDLEYYLPAPKNIKLMNDWKIAATDFIVTYPGEYARLGATDDIAEVIIKISRPDIKFIFACRIKNERDAIKKAAIQKKLAQAGALDKVIFTDTYGDMEKIYNLSDVILFPVRNMQGKFDVPLAVIEAMACAKPVIISDIPILREFANEKNSAIIKTGDIPALQSAILDLQQNTIRREHIGQNARRYVEENFNIKAAAEKYARIYTELN